MRYLASLLLTIAIGCLPAFAAEDDDDEGDTAPAQTCQMPLSLIHI